MERHGSLSQKSAPVYTIDDTNPTSYSAFVGTDKSGKATASEEQGNAISEMGKNINITLDGETRNAWETAAYCADQIASLGYRLQPSDSTSATSRPFIPIRVSENW